MAAEGFEALGAFVDLEELGEEGGAESGRVAVAVAVAGDGDLDGRVVLQMVEEELDDFGGSGLVDAGDDDGFGVGGDGAGAGSDRGGAAALPGAVADGADAGEIGEGRGDFRGAGAEDGDDEAAGGG